jgi:hypothetical protein
VPEASKIDDNPRKSYLSAVLHFRFDNHQQSVEGASALIYRMNNLTTNPVVEAACDDNSLRRVRTLWWRRNFVVEWYLGMDLDVIPRGRCFRSFFANL